MKFPRHARILWTSTLVLLALLGGAAGPAQAAQEDHGTLVANDGKHIYDWQLERLIDRFIGNNYHNKVLCFTECYGGDKVDEFVNDRNTTILTGGVPGTTTMYNGYHRGLAKALKPGTTTKAAHQAGINHQLPGDSPTSTGPNQGIGVGSAGGAVKSCHVLIWAGHPEKPDWDDIADIKNNFAGQPNTTVTVLSGNGAGADGAATFRDLRRALRQIGAMMNPNEQFILFVTDHGNIDGSERNVITPGGGGVTNVSLAFDPAVYATMMTDPANDPYVAVFTEPGAPPIAPGTLTISFNGTPYTVGQNVQEIPLDYDDDGVADQFEYYVPLLESAILSGNNQISLVNNGSADLTFEYVSLDSGAIRRPGPVTP